MGAPLGYAAYQLSQPAGRSLSMTSKVTVKRGDEILEGPYPKRFIDFIGQDTARLQIMAAITSALQRGEVMDHVLLASGFAGVGKTALGRLTAHQLGTGFVELGGKVKDVDAAAALKEMQDGDVLFLDEVHRMVQGGKGGAEWLLTLMQDGTLQTPGGIIQAPKITVIAATTDKQKLPETILGRFAIVPPLEPYTSGEAFEIVKLTAKGLGFGGEHLPMPEGAWITKVARAADNNPRRIRMLLKTVRDVAISSKDEDGTPGNLSDEGYDLRTALQWSGLTEDGLTQEMQDYLTTLVAYGGSAGAATLKMALHESDIMQVERALIQKGFIVVTPRGRQLTEFGAPRAEEVAVAQVATARHREAASQKEHTA
jgi:Holliday junction DNA helicase RuvB